MSESVKGYFEKVSSQWDTLRQSLYGDEVREAVVKAARITPSDTVLDVGAGTGFLAEAASKIARKVIALDFSVSMTQEAMTKLEGKNVEFKLGSAERIPLADSSVDVVVANMILHHCPNPSVAISEMMRVLKPQGRLALSDMQEHDQEWLRKEHADLWLGFKISTVEGMLKDSGMVDARVQPLASCCSSEREGTLVEIPMFLAHGTKR